MGYFGADAGIIDGFADDFALVGVQEGTGQLVARLRLRLE